MLVTLALPGKAHAWGRLSSLPRSSVFLETGKEQTPPLSTAGGDGEDQRPPTPGPEGQHGVSLLGFLEKQDSLS